VIHDQELDPLGIYVATRLHVSRAYGTSEKPASTPRPSRHRSVTRPKPGTFLTGKSRIKRVMADLSNSISNCPFGLFLSEQICRQLRVMASFLTLASILFGAIPADIVNPVFSSTPARSCETTSPADIPVRSMNGVMLTVSQILSLLLTLGIPHQDWPWLGSGRIPPILNAYLWTWTHRGRSDSTHYRQLLSGRASAHTIRCGHSFLATNSAIPDRHPNFRAS